MPFYASFRIDNPARYIKPAVDESVAAVPAVDDKLASPAVAATDSPAETAEPRTTITDAHRERLTDFHKDIFRTGANLYPDWDEVTLEFNLRDPLSVTFKRPPPSGATKTVNLEVSDTPSPRTGPPSLNPINITSEQLGLLRAAAAPSDALSISVRELKSRPQDDPTVKAIGNSNDTSFYFRLGEWFIEHFMDRRDYMHLIHHAGQHGVFAYGGYFVELVPNKTDKMLLGSMEDKDRKQYITAGEEPDEYLLVAEQRIVEKDTISANPDKNFCTIITRARYNRNTGEIVGPVMITAQFPDGISAAEAQTRTKRLMAAYAAQHDVILSPSAMTPRDIGTLTLQSTVWTPQSRIAALLCGALLIAGVVCVILIALHILPVLPFLVDLGMKIGLSTPLLSGLVVGLGTLVASGAAGLWSFLSLGSSVSSHKSPAITSSTLTSTPANPTEPAHPTSTSLGPHGPAATRTPAAGIHSPIDLAGGTQTPTTGVDAPSAKPR